METGSPFVCNYCCSEYYSYSQWLLHLTSRIHQETISTSPGHGLPLLRDKVVVVRGIPSTIPLIDVAEHFSLMGPIVNFIFRGFVQEEDEQGTMNVCVVFQTRDSMRLSLQEENMWMQGSRLVVRRMIYDEEYQRQPMFEPAYPPVPLQNTPRTRSINGDGCVGVEDDSQSINGVDEDAGQIWNEYQKLAAQIVQDLSEVKLEDQISGFWQLAGLSSTQLKKRASIGRDLLEILKPVFDECTIYSVGPHFLGIATEFDALNFVVDPFGKMEKERAVIFCDNESQESMTSGIYDLLKKEQYRLRFCRDVEKTCSRISIGAQSIEKISFKHRGSGILVNVMVENYLLVQDNRLIKFLTSLDPRLHPILTLVSFFGSVYNVFPSGDEAFQNHALLWMLLTFMASGSGKVLPTVNELFSANTSPLILENVDIGFSNDKDRFSSQSPPMMNDAGTWTLSVIALLKEFFEFFEKADLKRFVVCPAVGKLVLITAFGKVIGKSFPEEIKMRYLKGHNGAPRGDKFYSGSPMGLQHPLDLVSNLTQNVTLPEVSRFQGLCAAARNKLDKILTGETQNLISIFVNLKECINGNSNINGILALPAPQQDEDSSSSSESDQEEIPKDVTKLVEESSWEMDTEDEENPLDDDGRASFEQIRKGKIRVNQSLRKYFEQGIAEIKGAEDILFMDVRRKFQSLWVQYVLEFNSKFWCQCFGFELKDTFTQEDFSKTDDSWFKSLTLQERFDSITTEDTSSGAEFECSTRNNSISDILYKKKVWKKKFLLAHIRPLWALVTNNCISKSKKGIELSSLKKMVKLSPSRRMEFKVRLDITYDLREDEDVPKNENIAAFINVGLQDISYNVIGRSLRNKKLRFLTSVYEKLALKYCNLRIKQWFGSCKNLDFKTFDGSCKKEQQQKKRQMTGHPRWRKFKRKWSIVMQEKKEREEQQYENDKRKQEREKCDKEREKVEKKTEKWKGTWKKFDENETEEMSASDIKGLEETSELNIESQVCHKTLQDVKVTAATASTAMEKCAKEPEIQLEHEERPETMMELENDTSRETGESIDFEMKTESDNKDNQTSEEGLTVGLEIEKMSEYEAELN